MGQTQPIQVLVVVNDHVDARRIIEMLRRVAGYNFRPRRARRLSEALRLLEDGGTDAALFHLQLPDAQGVVIVGETQRAAPSVPLVVLSDRADDPLAAAALQEGAQDFLIMGDLTEEVLARSLSHAIARQRLQTTLRSLSLNDELTGLYNRRGFVSLAENRQKLAAREGARTSLIFGDLDDLKYVNDTFGHPEGDRALQEVADVFRKCFRASDIVARIGGDEFCALLADASESSEILIRERLQRALEARNSRPGRAYRLSLSVGIAHLSGSAGFEAQLAHADAEMYMQKRNKRAREAAAGALHKPSPA
jgi:two-component system, cell cycle response regulator